MNPPARQRSDEFLRIANQFKLGELVTEASHPVTRDLSEVAQRDAAAALRLLFQVDEDVVRTYRRVADSGILVSIASQVVSALQTGGRIFFTGCGATGRLSILLDSMWREFWQQPCAAGRCHERSGEDWENRTFSVMAGGDFALIKSVEGFEDYTAFGRKQLRDLGVRAGDVVFAITEGGETSFVIGTAWEGIEAGARVYFVYNNPDDVLCRHVERSREVIQDPRITKLNLTTGPMAIRGSTRMQATTIQLCVLSTLLEMVLRRLLPSVPPASGDSPGSPADPSVVPGQFLAGLDRLLQAVVSDGVIDGLAALVQAEEAAYRAGGRANYHADRFAIDVLTDTTERSPTFSTPAFRKCDDEVAAESWSFLFLPNRPTVEAWNWLLKRQPRCIEWTADDLRGLVPPDRFERAAAVLNTIRRTELLKFRIGGDGLPARPIRSQDFTLGVAGASETWCPSGVPLHVAGATRNRSECFTAVALLRFVCGKESGVWCAGPGAGLDPWTMVTIEVPDQGLWLDGLRRVAVKMVLNAISTCLMTRLGRVLGNTMIYVVASNLKLIDRATRYIALLTGVGYEEANRLLFEAIEFVEPRMRAGQSYPPVVGLAVWRARQGGSFAEAEARNF